MTELMGLLNLPDEIRGAVIIIGIILTLVLPLFRFVYWFKNAILNDHFNSSSKAKYLQIAKELDIAKDTVLANKFYDLFKERAIKEYAKAATGRYIPNSIRQLFALTVSCLLLLTLIFACGYLLNNTEANNIFDCIAKLLQVVVLLLATCALVALCFVCSACILFDVSRISAIPKRIKGALTIRIKRTAAPITNLNHALKIAKKYGDYCLVDARKEEEFRKNGLSGAIESHKFKDEAILYKNVPIFVYSGYGKRSSTLVDRYKKNGYISDAVGIYNLGGIYPDVILFQRFALQLELELRNRRTSSL